VVVEKSSRKNPKPVSVPVEFEDWESSDDLTDGNTDAEELKDRVEELEEELKNKDGGCLRGLGCIALVLIVLAIFGVISISIY